MSISTAELASMRAEAAALVLPDTCVIYAISNTTDAYGDPVLTETVRGTVACALAAESRASQDNAILADRESSAAFYTLSVAHDTVLGAEDKVVVGQYVYRVITLHDNQSFKVVKRALVEWAGTTAIALTVEGAARASASTYDAGETALDEVITLELTITNTGDFVLVLANPTNSGSVSVDSWSETTLAPGESATCTVTPDTSTNGTQSGYIEFTSSGTPSPYRVTFEFEVSEYLLRDQYSATQDPLLDSSIRDVTGEFLFSENGYLFGGSQNDVSPAWGDSLISYDEIARQAGRVMEWLFVPEGRNAIFYVGMALDLADLATEPTAGIGLHQSSGQMRVLTTLGDQQMSDDIGNIRPMEYLFCVALNDIGAYVLLSTFAADSGNAMDDPVGIPQYPSARLLYVQMDDVTATLYPFASFLGVDAAAQQRENDNGHYFQDLRVRDVPDWATADPLATFADRFTRADNTSVIGNGWVSESGTWGINNNQLYLSNNPGGFLIAYRDVGISDGIFCFDYIVPAAGDAYVMIRRVSAGNYIRVRLSQGQWAFQYFTGGAFGGSIIASAYTFTPGATYRVAIHAYGNKYQIFINDVAQATDWFADAGSNHITGTGIGLIQAGDAITARLDKVAVYPHTVTLPAELQSGAVPRVLTPGSTLASDTFTDVNGTRLNAHTAESGGAWTEHAGTWTINASGRAAVSGTDHVLATQNLGVTDAECSVVLRQPAVLGSYVFAGMVIRYVDSSNWLVIREADDLIGQPLHHEIELVERLGGSENVVRKVQMDAAYTANAEHTIKAHVKDNLLQVFLNDKPRLAHLIPDALAAGTRFGLYREATNDGGVTFDNWQVKAL